MESINATSLHRKSGRWGTHLLLLVHRKFEVVTRQRFHTHSLYQQQMLGAPFKPFLA
jgi:hypothetical protein